MSWEGTACLSVDELRRHYETMHSTLLNPCEYGFMTLTELPKSLPYLVEVFTNDQTEECVKLTSLYLFAKNVRSLLHTYHYQQLFLCEFSVAYTKYIRETLQPKVYGYSSMEELLGAIPQVVWIKGHGHKRIVVLKNDMKSHLSSLDLSPANHEHRPSASEHILAVPESLIATDLELGADSDGPRQPEQELLRLTNDSPVDLLCAPVPSCLPSPQLRPDPVIFQSANLIQFEEHPQEPLGSGSAVWNSTSLSSNMALYVQQASSLQLTEKEQSPHTVGKWLCRTSWVFEEMILNQEGQIEPPVPVKKEDPALDSRSSCFSAAVLAPPCPLETPESPLSKDPSESPAKKHPQNRVKLAANFSFAPITKL
ncbi:meiosis regulator and mRNA stability factor 1-like [Manis pentadactyla]|uniref:meiosis regulator and mRNA stability factor 1-like n=1 Tax=Manis pentadactyla TaxID=143292 RepID=UPI00255C347E|nr:meiosis regulator and mRNA stability factor 1-like [Manis pentadactyla]